MAMNVCVYCASSNHVSESHQRLARELGERLAKAGHTLVFGGTDSGLMATLARAVHARHGKVIGVIPDSLAEREMAYEQADELIVARDLRERKAAMAERADAFIALPGGFGTLDEIMETLSLKILGAHTKPVVLVNVDGFYDPLLALLRHYVDQRVAKPRYMDLFEIVDSAEAAVEACEP